MPASVVLGQDKPASQRVKVDWGAEHDPVNHPAHYSHPSGIECITIAEHMNFNLGNAIKYIWRAGAKGKIVEDLEKARWYLAREIERQKKLGR